MSRNWHLTNSSSLIRPGKMNGKIKGVFLLKKTESVLDLLFTERIENRFSESFDH